MKSTKIIVGLATICTLLTTGCGAINNLVQSKVGDVKSTAVAASGTVVSAANSANATAAPEITKAVAAATKQVKDIATNAPEATEAPASDSGFNAGNLDSNLDKLKSYREHVIYTFEGTDAKGTAQKGGLDLTQEIITGSKDQHVKMGNTTAGDTGKSYEMFQVGDSTYIYNGTGGADSSCTSFSSSSSQATDPSALFKPRDMLGNLQGATLINKGENVNGIIADHYKASDKDFGVGLFSAAKGDIWVAQDGGWVVKYVGEATGKNALLGATAEGKITWEYNIEDANKIDKIVLPPECVASKPADDIPMPDNITEKGNMGSMITFKSPDDVANITEFYRTKLTAQGWKEDEGAMEGMMSFGKDQRALTIMISKEDTGGSNVVITDTKSK